MNTPEEFLRIANSSIYIPIIKIFVYGIFFFTLAFCRNPMEPIDLPSDFLGQLETDIDYAIIKPDGSVWTWGNNSTGQLGDGTINPSINPKKITTLENVCAIDLAEGGAYAVDKAGNIWFWGDRIIWSEPPEKDTIVTIPKKISFLPGVKSIQVFSTNIILLKNDGTVWQLIWDHKTPTKYLLPSQINSLTNIKVISNFLVLTNDGILNELPEYSFWEAENGCLNNNEVFPLKDIFDVKNMFFSFSILLLKDGTVWAWGRNLTGSLGDGTLQDDPNPKKCQNLTDITDISVNGGRCLALKKDGTVWNWGFISSDSDPKTQPVPQMIKNLNNVKIIHASAAAKSLVMKNDGTYWSIDIKTKEIKKIEL